MFLYIPRHLSYNFSTRIIDLKSPAIKHMIADTTINAVVDMFDPGALEAAPQHLKAEDYLGFPMVIAHEGVPNSHCTGMPAEEAVAANPTKYTKEEREAFSEEFYMAYVCRATADEVRIFYPGISSNLTKYDREKWSRHVNFGNIYSLKYLWEVCERIE